jgi:hypothetical protein
MQTCLDCGKIFSQKGIGSHRWRVHGAGRDFKPSRKGRIPWNKGLTANDSRVAKSRDTLKERFKSGDLISWQLGKTKLTDERVAKQATKIAETIKKKIANKNWHVSFSKRRTYERNGIKFHGTWELKYAIWLDEQGIKWIRNETTFPYTFNGKQHQYTPDFFLPDFNLYVEIKGYETEKDRQKWLAFPHTLKILKGSHLKELGIIDTYKDV